MPQSLADSVDYDEISLVNPNAPTRRSSRQYQAPRSSIGERKSSRAEKAIDNNDPDQDATRAVTISADNSVPLMSMGNKHWQVPAVDDVIKYMSSVPDYLQRLEQGHSAREKALNFGVLDWGRLENWRSQRKEVANRSVDSPYSTTSSSAASSSTFGSSSQCDRSTDSPIAQSKQTPAFNARQNSFVAGRRSLSYINENDYVQIKGNPDSKVSCSRPSEKGKIKYSDMKGVSCEKPRYPDVASSSSAPIVDAIPGFAHKKVKSQIGRLKEKFHRREQPSFPGGVYFSADWLEEQCTVAEGCTLDHIERIEHARRVSYDSAAVSNRRHVEVTRKSISGDCLPLGSQFARRREISPGRLAGLKRSLSVKPMKHSNVSDNFHEYNGISRDRSRRSVSPHNLLSTGLYRIRNSSWREGSSSKYMKQTNGSGNSLEEDASSSSRSRLAPLWKIFDPIFKLKRIQIHLSGDKLPLGDGLKYVQSMHANFSSLPSQFSEAGCSVQAKKQARPTRQALLKLIWKNELPLFMFSVDDSSFLSASMGQGSVSQENDFNCTYTLFTVHEAKKKGGVWIGQGNKSQKRDVGYDLIGQMRVSSSEGTSIGSESRFVMREFVLFGGELSPKTSENANFQFNNELAAIVIQVPNEQTENGDVQGNKSRDSSQRSSEKNHRSSGNLHIEQRNRPSRVASVIAVLPRIIHSISSTGGPSPLIERWRSGGSCDCGGWDEGCRLTVLTDMIQEGSNPSSSDAFLAHAAHRIELFPQGDDRGNKHTFRLTAFEEEVYKVEFGESIALVQAFAMSVAILHSKKPHTLSGLYYSMKSKSIRENTAANQTSIASEDTQAEPPESYVLDHLSSHAKRG